jgi:hypothetical protein
MRDDLLQRLGQVAVLVERVDQQPTRTRSRSPSLVSVSCERRWSRSVGVSGVARLRSLSSSSPPAPVRGELGRPVASDAVGLRRRRLARGRRQARLGGRCAREEIGLAVGVLALERRIFHQQPLDFLIELDRRQLQQANRLLQLWREG